jgi:LacI family transcriptional regulator
MQRRKIRKGPPGIVEVASRARVSIATVSRAFNTPDMVRLKTRRRIEEAANELGYIRNRLAGSLHSSFSGTVGLIVPTIDNAIFAEMIDAFASRLRKHDRTLLIATHGYDLSLEVAIVRSLLERRIDGVVMVGLDHEAVPLNMLEQRNVPAIAIWNYREDAALPCIGADNFRAGHDVAQYLVELGHRDIALIFPDTASNDRARDRMNGALSAIRKSGYEITQDRILSCPYDIGEAKRLATRMLRQDRPSAILCGNDIIAQGVMYAAYALGLDIPSDISIAGIGDFRGSADIEPGLTTIRLPARRIGTLAADRIVDMSETGQLPQPRNLALDLSFVKRGSTTTARS